MSTLKKVATILLQSIGSSSSSSVPFYTKTSFNFKRNLNYSTVAFLNKMKAIRVHELGGPEVCKFEHDVPIPEPNDDQIQFKVEAAGVNPVDVLVRTGMYVKSPALPYIPGFDSSGVVTKVGKNIKKLKVGDRVFAILSDSGTYAEYTLSRPQYTFKLDEKFSYEEGSALGVPYFTAYRALFSKGNARPGESVLIHGASGAVGIAAIQLAKATGLQIIGTAGTEEGIKLIKQQGADYAFNHREPKYVEKIKEHFPNGIDIILEMLANVNLNTDLQLLTPLKGRAIVIGCRGNVEINPVLIMAKETTVTAVSLYNADEQEFDLINSHIQALVKANCIKPVLNKTFELKEAAQAQTEAFNNSGTFGRITIKI